MTLKPMIVAVNVDEGQLAGEFDLSAVIGEQVPVIKICATLEKELGQLDEESLLSTVTGMVKLPTVVGVKISCIVKQKNRPQNGM
jgi:ribosome-binding ATPase YchF (GTP1/OBG family)